MIFLLNTKLNNIGNQLKKELETHDAGIESAYFLSEKRAETMNCVYPINLSEVFQFSVHRFA